MKTSIALATYNGSKYIAEQLDSISKQTVMPNEVVISDDNSSDGTYLILQNFKKNAPFDVVLLKNKYKGFNSNFENALNNVTGDIIFICDQDDVWFENKIEKILEYFNDHPEHMLIIHDLEFCNSELIPIGETKIERFKRNKQSLDGYVTGMATAVRSDFLKTCFPFPKYTNYDSWIHACANILKVKGLYLEVLAKYRRHQSNATKTNILNLPYKPKVQERLNHKFKSNLKLAILKEIALHESLIEYLEYLKSSKLELVVPELDLPKKKERLKIIINRLKYRNRLLEQSFFIRFFMAIKFYFNNGYSDYAGLNSMIKDILKLYQK